VRGRDDRAGARGGRRSGVGDRLVERGRPVVDAREQMAVQVDGGQKTEGTLAG